MKTADEIVYIIKDRVNDDLETQRFEIEIEDRNYTVTIEGEVNRKYFDTWGAELLGDKEWLSIQTDETWYIYAITCYDNNGNEVQPIYNLIEIEDLLNRADR